MGTWPVNASTLAQSRNAPGGMLVPTRRGTTRRTIPRRPVSTPTTRYQPSMRAISISFARTSRAPSMLISWRSSTSLRSSTSPVRRSKCCRSIRSETISTRPWRDLGELGRRDEHRPPRDGREHAGHRRVVLAEPHDQVVDLAEPPAVAVAQRAADDQRQVQHGGRRGRGHRRENLVLAAASEPPG